MNLDAFFGGGVLFIILYAAWSVACAVLYKVKVPIVTPWQAGGAYTGTYMIVMGVSYRSSEVIPMDVGLSYILGIWVVVAFFYAARARARLTREA